MMRYILSFCFCLSVLPLFSQKMLLLERAYRVRTTKMYIGDELRFRLKGEEDYWYKRTIEDILPEQQTLMLDNYVVKLSDIDRISVQRRPLARIAGNTLFTFGATLTLATTLAVLFRDQNTKFAPLYGTAAGSLGVGYFLSSRRTLKMGQKHRLRTVEIKFPF